MYPESAIRNFNDDIDKNTINSKSFVLKKKMKEKITDYEEVYAGVQRTEIHIQKLSLRLSTLPPDNQMIKRLQKIWKLPGIQYRHRFSYGATKQCRFVYRCYTTMHRKSLILMYSVTRWRLSFVNGSINSAYQRGIVGDYGTQTEHLFIIHGLHTIKMLFKRRRWKSLSRSTAKSEAICLCPLI